jgi:hypothetical protein
MAVIKISELRPVGSELFQDSESFLNELNEQEMLATIGGDDDDGNGGGNINIVQASISVFVVVINGGGGQNT